MNIEYVNLEDRFCLTDDGTILPIVSMYDNDGNECGSDEAVVVVVGKDGYGWASFEIEHDVEGHRLH